jgi:hypothetical protein
VRRNIKLEKIASLLPEEKLSREGRARRGGNALWQRGPDGCPRKGAEGSGMALNAVCLAF